MFKITDFSGTKSTLNKQFNFLYRLNNCPNTLLGEPKLRALYYDYLEDEFTVDRHPQAFESI